MTSFREEAWKGKKTHQLDFFYMLHDGMEFMLGTHRLVLDSVKLVRAVVALVGLKWRHLQVYLGSWPGLMESSVKKTVLLTVTPVAASLGCIARAASLAMSLAASATES